MICGVRERLSLWGAKHSWRYATAFLTTAAAIWVRNQLHPWLGVECPFSLFYVSVLATAWLAGSGPALCAIALGTLSAAHFFIEPASSLYIARLADLIQLSIYVFVNVVAAMLFNRLERQRRIAEKRSAENERLSQSLRETDERKDEFLALLAHELRNPLAPIRTSATLLDSKCNCGEDVRRLGSIIRRQSDNLVRITDDLLDVSRFSRGRVELKLETLDLMVPILEAVEMSEDLMHTKSHRFYFIVPDDPIWVRGDKVRLAQLTSNLLTNAAKYTPDHGRIALQVECIDDTAIISVTDNGIGYAQSDEHKILEPFVQIDTSRTRDYGGLGLGLTIVSRLVALHGGSLSCHSRGPGLGSRFSVSLPLASPSSSPYELPVSNTIACSSMAAPGTHSEGRVKKILVVDDNLDAANLLCELLESEGFATDKAIDGIEALDKAISILPDVILLDIGLPGMDGYEVARRIRRTKIIGGTRIIALTGWGGARDRDLAMNAGIDSHLVKPIVIDDLLMHLRGMSIATDLLAKA